jgi:hypothetical protein
MTGIAEAHPRIVAAFAGLALIVLFLKMGMSDQAGNEHAGSVKVTTSSRTQVSRGDPLVKRTRVSWLGSKEAATQARAH